VAGIEDEVDVVAAPADLAEPVRERELGVAAEALPEKVERLLDVAGAHEQVEILDQTADAQIALERVAAADEEIDAGHAQLPEHAAVEPKRLRRRGGALAWRVWGAIF